MTTAGRHWKYGPVGVGHLTLLDIAPPEWVTLAHQAGFDAVGIRAMVAGPEEEAWPMSPGSPMVRETVTRLRDTGVRVNDVEIIRLTPDSKPEPYLPLFEVGAELGASFVNVIPADPEVKRAAENFAAIAEVAATFGLRPGMEAMSYTPIATLDDAITVAGDSPGGIIIDPLHLHRAGVTPERLRSVDPRVLTYYQLCDAPWDPPVNLPRPRRLPRGQSLGNITDLQLEARALRMLPGDGQLPLREYLAALPPGRPLSVEAPNVALRELLGPLEFLRHARAHVDRLLATVPTPAGAE
jgi:sugar phosphate isomerase/epimerase